MKKKNQAVEVRKPLGVRIRRQKYILMMRARIRSSLLLKRKN